MSDTMEFFCTNLERDTLTATAPAVIVWEIFASSTMFALSFARAVALAQIGDTAKPPRPETARPDGKLILTF